MGVLLTKAELVALIRRIDLDGDAKISYEEFYEGVRSQFAQTNKIGQYMRSKGVLSSQNGNTSTIAKTRSDLINSAKKGKSTTPRKVFEGTVCNKRPKSAQKTTMRTKKLIKQFAQAACPCEHHNHLNTIQRNSVMNEDLEESPNRLNRSVTFNNQVRVREFDSLHAQQLLLEEERRRCTPILECKRLSDNPYLPVISQSPLR